MPRFRVGGCSITIRSFGTCMRQASTSPNSVADWASSKDQRGGQADMSYSDDSDDDAGYKKYEPSWADSGRKSSFKRREDDVGKCANSCARALSD